VTSGSAHLLAYLKAGFASAGDRLGVVDYATEIAGCPIQVRFAGGRFREDLTASFDHLPQPGSDRPVDVINVWYEDASTVGDHARGRQLPDRELLEARPSDVAGFPGCLDVFDPAESVAWRRVSSMHLPWWEIAAPLRNPVFWLLQRRNRWVTHAAAVARSGQAVLIVGPSGAGKSTTALTCLLAGFDYLGDDYTVLSLDGEPRIHSLYGSAKLSPSGVEGMEDLVRDAAEFLGTHGEKVVVWPSRTFPQRVATSARVVAILAPTITDSRDSTLMEISPAEALRALAPSSILQFPSAGAQMFEALARLARSVPCWSLRLGSDRRQIPDVVGQSIP
jgi:hypothetical protein